MMTVSENQEGAGLGLIISMLMLRNLSLNENNFLIESDGKITTAELKLPLSLVSPEKKKEIKEARLEEIDSLPQFPEHIQQIQKLLLNDEVNIKELSQIIIRDSSLTSKIIQFANSPLYVRSTKVVLLSQAIKIIGLNGIKAIIYSFTTESILKKKYNQKKLAQAYERTNRIADYAFTLARTRLSRKKLENLYIAALLHDIGSIMQMGLDENLIFHINRLCHEKGVSLSLLESLTKGLNHRRVGVLLAKKWNFPEIFIEVIEHYHSPESASACHQEIVYHVHLASLFEQMQKNAEKIYTVLSEGACDYFRIKTIDDIENLLKELD